MKLAFCILEGETGHDAAYRLLEKLYREETGQNLPRILRTDRGKPYFCDSPYHFSIAHTPRHAFCVLARQNIAIDAEEADRKINPALAEKILSPGEKLRYGQASDKHRALLTFWVLKEAEAKLSGEGLRGYPNHTDFSLTDTRVQELDGCLVAIFQDL